MFNLLRLKNIIKKNSYKSSDSQTNQLSKQAEFLALQNQINPHFLYNVLDSIRGEALKAGVHNIADITEALSIYFRYSITEINLLVTILEELENVDNYFKIQQYRFGSKLQMEVDFEDDNSNIANIKCPKLMLQPIVENAIFHGIEKKVEGGYVLIRVKEFLNKIEIWIHDNGVGMMQDELHALNANLQNNSFMPETDNKHGIALYNVSRRIKILFGEEYGIHVYSIQGLGTDVCITLPRIMDELKNE